MADNGKKASKPRLTDHREASRHEKGCFAQLIIAHNDAVMDPSTLAGCLRKYHALLCFLLVGGAVLSAQLAPPGWLRDLALQCTQLSHGVERSEGAVYVSGPHDWKFVAFYATVSTLARFVVNELFLEAVAQAGGVKVSLSLSLPPSLCLTP